jgi:hypothetical protein
MEMYVGGEMCTGGEMYGNVCGRRNVWKCMWAGEVYAGGEIHVGGSMYVGGGMYASGEMYEHVCGRRNVEEVCRIQVDASNAGDNHM